MSIFGIAGPIGTGKSFIQLFLALEYANEREKQLVFNFPMNFDNLRKYCSLPKYVDNSMYMLLSKILGIKPSIKTNKPRYPWILNLLDKGGISFIPSPKNIQALMIPDSVVCLDEAGILLNARSFKDTPKELLADLAQSRKDGIDLFWAAQFDEQVDYQFRLLTQYWIHADGLSLYDKEMKRPKLMYKKYYWFRAADYFDWLHNKRDKTSHFKTRFAYSSRYLGGFLTTSDKILFNVFDSFSRLDSTKTQSFIHTIQSSPLPTTYYRFLLGKDYLSVNDPFSKNYISSPIPPCKTIPITTTEPTPPHRFSGGATTQQNKQLLIKTALSLSRTLRIKPPFFQSMTELDIQKWISTKKRA